MISAFFDVAGGVIMLLLIFGFVAAATWFLDRRWDWNSRPFSQRDGGRLVATPPAARRAGVVPSPAHQPAPLPPNAQPIDRAVAEYLRREGFVPPKDAA